MYLWTLLFSGLKDFHQDSFLGIKKQPSARKVVFVELSSLVELSSMVALVRANWNQLLAEMKGWERLARVT